jgi:hypothetical protein
MDRFKDRFVHGHVPRAASRGSDEESPGLSHVEKKKLNQMQ